MCPVAIAASIGSAIAAAASVGPEATGLGANRHQAVIATPPDNTGTVSRHRKSTPRNAVNAPIAAGRVTIPAMATVPRQSPAQPLAHNPMKS